MKKLRLLGAACACLAVVSFNVNATLLTHNLDGVVIDGTTYNVTFVQDNGPSTENSYDAIDTSWPGPLITFTDDAAASAAVDAILIAAIAAGPNFDFTPAYSPGDGTDGFRVAYAVDGVNYEFILADNSATTLVVNRGSFSQNRTIMNIYSFATFEAVVPVPPAIWLFGSGLLGLVGIARRKKAA